MLSVHRKHDHPGIAVWFTGLSGAGKTTICNAVDVVLSHSGFTTEILDGDEVRSSLCKDLGFSREDRKENVRRIAYVSGLLVRHGVIVLVSAISPYRIDRDEARRTIGNMIEVYVLASLNICESRDPKGLYKKARSGLLTNFTGLDAPYESPLEPDVICFTEHESIDECVLKVVSKILKNFPPSSENSTLRSQLNVSEVR